MTHIRLMVGWSEIINCHDGFAGVGVGALNDKQTRWSWIIN